ncbi:MAG: hypothetical protein ACRDIU_05195 [Actinomycetota bacterium]
MFNRSRTFKYLLLIGLLPLAIPAARAVARSNSIPFSDARLKIEYNATDGDAGLQIFADAEPWRQIGVANPAGREVFEAEAEDVIQNYGLTELFSESSEPPFVEFPFEKFKELFPEGKYTFTGQTIDGREMRSTFRLSHRVPDGPRMVSPANDSEISRDSLVVDWDPVTKPAGIDIVGYQVLVVAEEPLSAGGNRTFDATLDATVTRLPIPAEFLTTGDYKAEVLAIDAGGNQTLTEHAFSIT